MIGNRSITLWILILVIHWVQATPLFGETIVGIASWMVDKEKPQLKIHLEDQLSKKQVKLINSGFSTYSHLEIILPEGKFSKERTLFSVECTVKYDTWEEYYDIIKINKKVGLEKAKSFKTFADSCLTAYLSEQTDLDYFIKNGGLLKASLKLDQIGADRADNIREWLIKQQSGVVKGLFSHMLGDLKLSEVIRITIQIPPLAAQNNATSKSEVIAQQPPVRGQRDK